uniref:hypothetical protein n=1 Tax=Escherichia marmotae TaxID=1499973 RepID=UPI00215B52C0
GYYSKSFSEGRDSKLYNALEHYENIFKKMDEAITKVGNNTIKKMFEDELLKMPITNIELIPYRTEKKPDELIGLESS